MEAVKQVKQPENVFDIVGKTVRRVEIIERTEKISASEIGRNNSECVEAGASGETIRRFFFTDGTKIDIK